MEENERRLLDAEHVVVVNHAFESEKASKETRWCARCAATQKASSKTPLARRAKNATQWYRSKVRLGEWLCKKCYREEMLSVNGERACFECNSRETRGSWLRSKTHPGNYLCFNCYSRELSKTSNKQCASCRAEKTGQKWYKSKRDDETFRGANLCRRCYEKERLALMKGTKSCSMCSTRTTAGRWCKSKNNAGADLCRKCYRKELKDAAATKERIQRVDELEKIRLAISG